MVKRKDIEERDAKRVGNQMQKELVREDR